MFFDAHADIWTDIILCREQGKKDRLRNFHYPRMRESGMLGGIFVVWMDPPHDAAPQRRTLEAIKHMALELAEASDIVTVVETYGDIAPALENKRLAVVLGLEGLSGLGADAEFLFALYQMGFRHASLTWNEENEFATGVRGTPDRGLTGAGVQALEYMEHLGMVVDVSHANEKTFWDICLNTHKPLIASHSNCASLCNNRRNLTDRQLRAIAEKGGVVGINAYSPFIHSDPAKQDAGHLMLHIRHMVQVMGEDHVGFGFDFGDYLSSDTLGHFQEGDVYGAAGLQDVTQVPSLLDSLGKHGFSARQIDKFCRENMFRVLKEVL